MLAGVARRAAEACAFAEHGGDHRLLRGGGETQVDEAGTGDFGGSRRDPSRPRLREHRIDDLLRELARIRAQRLGELHRDIHATSPCAATFGRSRTMVGDDEGGFARALRGERDLLDRVGEQCFESMFMCGQHADVIQWSG